MEGDWEVVSSEFNGGPIEQAPLSAFSFSGGIVTFIENGRELEVEYALDPTKSPKLLKMSAIQRMEKPPSIGIYSLEKDELQICLAQKRDVLAPIEMKTKEGDSRLLLRLIRSPKAAK